MPVYNCATSKAHWNNLRNKISPYYVQEITHWNKPMKRWRDLKFFLFDMLNVFDIMCPYAKDPVEINTSNLHYLFHINSYCFLVMVLSSRISGLYFVLFMFFSCDITSRYSRGLW